MPAFRTTDDDERDELDEPEATTADEDDRGYFVIPAAVLDRWRSSAAAPR